VSAWPTSRAPRSSCSTRCCPTAPATSCTPASSATRPPWPSRCCSCPASSRRSPAARPRCPGLHIGGLDIVTRLGLALRTKSLNDELRLADVSLRSAVLTDSLTGLANRRAAEERLRSLTGLARLGMGPVSMILADMDGFAEVNERLGYAIGDRLLQAFAGLLHESCRTGDTVARLEAEAFLLLLPGTKLDAAWYVAERVRRRTAAIGAALGPDGPSLTASFGVAEHRPPDAWRDLLDRAEAALTRAKRAGRNRCEVA
jgi:diguanylate cyclase (GGDEF)-like protein